MIIIIILFRHFIIHASSHSIRTRGSVNGTPTVSASIILRPPTLQGLSRMRRSAIEGQMDKTALFALFWEVLEDMH